MQLSGREFLFRGFPVPSGSLACVLGNAAAALEHQAEVVLRLSGALLRGFAQPFRALDSILFHAPALGVHKAEIVLSFGVALFGGLAEELERLGVVLRDAFAAEVRPALEECRLGLRGFGGLAVRQSDQEECDNGGIVAWTMVARGARPRSVLQAARLQSERRWIMQ